MMHSRRKAPERAWPPLSWAWALWPAASRLRVAMVCWPAASLTCWATGHQLGEQGLVGPWPAVPAVEHSSVWEMTMSQWVWAMQTVQPRHQLQQLTTPVRGIFYHSVCVPDIVWLSETINMQTSVEIYWYICTCVQSCTVSGYSDTWDDAGTWLRCHHCTNVVTSDQSQYWIIYWTATAISVQPLM